MRELSLVTSTNEGEIGETEFGVLHVADDQFVIGFSDIKPDAVDAN